MTWPPVTACRASPATANSPISSIRRFTTNTRPYPARLDGRLDPAPSRWLWLVKWLLIIPHVVVLFFLWCAVTVLTAAAGLAILLTGRYPRAIFDFNVGVMRWTWRVAFYGLSAFGTDKYPPFSLQPGPSYPADFSVDYPQRLSRGLVLVKWWLLALPQYLIVAIFAGGREFGRNTTWRVTGGVGLIGLLALIAAVTLAISGRYPQRIFNLVMGLNRWCYRVLAYAALMRDEYPPFRLDTAAPTQATSPRSRPGRPRRSQPPPPADHDDAAGPRPAPRISLTPAQRGDPDGMRTRIANAPPSSPIAHPPTEGEPT